MKRLALLPVLAILSAIAVANPAWTADARAQQEPATVTIATVPTVPFGRFALNGVMYQADERGIVVLPKDANGTFRTSDVEPLEETLPDGREVEFNRFYGANAATTFNGETPDFGGVMPQFVATYDVYHEVRFEFHDLNGNPVEPERVQSIAMRSSHGKRLNIDDPTEEVKVQSARVVVFGRVGQEGLDIVVKDIYYTLEAVNVDGSNVVNVSQQKFFPTEGTTFNTTLSFYEARFKAKDALFGFPVGSKVKLYYPDDTVRAFELGDGATTTVDSLARGEYEVSVDAPGFSFKRPVALSRNQDVDLKVITYLDIAVVGLVILIIVSALVLAGRGSKFRRRMVRRMRGGGAAVASLLAILALVLGACSSSDADEPEPTTDEQTSTIDSPVLAYYYIWFTPNSWARAKTDYPELGWYNSDDKYVMRQHIRQAKAAGISGFIVSWKSTTDLNRRLEKLIEVAEDEQFHLSIIYQGLDFAREPLPVETVARDMKYFADRYASSPVFSMFEKPVIIWSGTWKFSTEDIAATTEPLRDRLLILASERNARDFTRVAPYVDGDAYYWSSVNPDTFPGYVEKLVGMADTVRESGGIWIAPAAPGFDAREVGGTSVVERADGATLLRQLEAAEASAPDAIGLISWNEFSENSHIEPSEKHGSRYLRVLAGAMNIGEAQIDAIDSSASGGADGAPRYLLLVVFGLGALVVAVLGLYVRRNNDLDLDDPDPALREDLEERRGVVDREGSNATKPTVGPV